MFHLFYKTNDDLNRKKKKNDLEMKYRFFFVKKMKYRF